jgi:hypothetical protein
MLCVHKWTAKQSVCVYGKYIEVRSSQGNNINKRKHKMRIKLSQSQWREIGVASGWIKQAAPAEKELRNGTIALDFTAWKEYMKDKTDDSLRYIIKDCKEAIEAMPKGNKAGYYQDCIHECADELRRRKEKNSK